MDAEQFAHFPFFGHDMKLSRLVAGDPLLHKMLQNSKKWITN